MTASAPSDNELPPAENESPPDNELPPAENESPPDNELPPAENESSSAAIRLDFIQNDPGLRLTEMDELEIRRHDRELKKLSHATKNRIAMVLVAAFVASLPVVLLIGKGAPSDSLMQIYYHWITVLASLTGASIGVTALSNK